MSFTWLQNSSFIFEEGKLLSQSMGVHMHHPDRVFKQSIISNNFPRRNTVKNIILAGGNLYEWGCQIYHK